MIHLSNWREAGVRHILLLCLLVVQGGAVDESSAERKRVCLASCGMASIATSNMESVLDVRVSTQETQMHLNGVVHLFQAEHEKFGFQEYATSLV